MSRSRLILFVIAGLSGAVVMLAALLWGVARTDMAAERAASALSEATGVAATIGGVRVSYWPTPRLRLTDVELASPPGFGAEPLLKAAEVDVRLPWSQPTAGFALEQLAVDGATLDYRVDAQGRDNLTPVLEALTSQSSAGPTEFAIDALEVSNGAIRYRDASDRTDLRFSGVSMTATDVTPRRRFPAAARLAGQAGDSSFHARLDGTLEVDPDTERYAAATLEVAGWVGGGSLPLRGVEWRASLAGLRADIVADTLVAEVTRFESLGARGKATLDVQRLLADPLVAFTLDTETFAPRAIAVGIDAELPAMADPGALKQAEVSVTGQLDARALSLTSMRAVIDQTTATGTLTWPFSDAPPVVRATLDRLDLDRYLPPPAAPAQSSGAAASAEETLEAAVEQLQALVIDADVTIAEASVAGVRFRDLRLQVDAGAPP